MGASFEDRKENAVLLGTAALLVLAVAALAAYSLRPAPRPLAAAPALEITPDTEPAASQREAETAEAPPGSEREETAAPPAEGRFIYLAPFDPERPPEVTYPPLSDAARSWEQGYTERAEKARRSIALLERDPTTLKPGTDPAPPGEPGSRIVVLTDPGPRQTATPAASAPPAPPDAPWYHPPHRPPHRPPPRPKHAPAPRSR